MERRVSAAEIRRADLRVRATKPTTALRTCCESPVRQKGTPKPRAADSVAADARFHAPLSLPRIVRDSSTADHNCTHQWQRCATWLARVAEGCCPLRLRALLTRRSDAPGYLMSSRVVTTGPAGRISRCTAFCGQLVVTRHSCVSKTPVSACGYR
jgi:hypothetical protein